MKVFPCLNKIPALPGNWQTLATDDPTVVGNWQDTIGDAMQYGVPTGAANGVTVLDVDAPEGWETLKQLGWVNWTACSKTYDTPSGGAHVYCRYVPGLRNSAGKLGPGLDVRGEGGYVVAYDPEAAQTALAGPLPELPKQFLDQLAEPAKAPQRERPGDVVEGGRNQYLASLGGRLQKQGLLVPEALVALNERDCSPPLPESEVMAIFNSVSRYDPHPEAIPERPPELVWARSLVDQMMVYLTDKEKVKGVPTGCGGLDEMLGGGKRLGELTVLCAPAKGGKSSLLHWLILKMLNKGMGVGYASREMSPETEVMPNLLTAHFMHNLLTAKTYDIGAITDAVNQWKLVFTPGYGAIEPDELFLWMDRCRTEAGIQFFVVDHFHYALQNPEDFSEISKFIRRIKTYTKQHNVHIDLVVQPKITQPGERLHLNSMRGGASIGQALDNLFLMTRVKNEAGRPTSVTELTLEVARHKLASPGSIYLQYDTTSMSFSEVVPETQPTPTGFSGESADTGPVADRGQNARWSGRQIT